MCPLSPSGSGTARHRSNGVVPPAAQVSRSIDTKTAITQAMPSAGTSHGFRPHTPTGSVRVACRFAGRGSVEASTGGAAGGLGWGTAVGGGGRAGGGGGGGGGQGG